MKPQKLRTVAPHVGDHLLRRCWLRTLESCDAADAAFAATREESVTAFRRAARPPCRSGPPITPCRAAITTQKLVDGRGDQQVITRARLTGTSDARSIRAAVEGVKLPFPSAPFRAEVSARKISGEGSQIGVQPRAAPSSKRPSNAPSLATRAYQTMAAISSTNSGSDCGPPRMALIEVHSGPWCT